MSEKTELLKQYIADNNLRWTSQRETITRTLFDADQHLTTEELFEMVHKEDPSIGYATVARTLRLLMQTGFCEQIDISDGTLRYKAADSETHHDHLVCTHCGIFVEVFSPELERIQENLVRQHGFLQKSHQLQIFGICSRCQKKAAAPVTSVSENHL